MLWKIQIGFANSEINRLLMQISILTIYVKFSFF